MATQEAEGLVERIERLSQEAGPEAQELLGAVMELYGEGLERIVEIVQEGGEAATPVRDRMIADGVVASLLLIHDLYPVPLSERVADALASVRPYMESHGGDVELVSIVDGVAHLRLQGSCNGCPASRATLELAIEEALQDAAPDLAGLEVEGVVAPRPPAPAGPSLPLAPAQPAPAAAGMALPMVQVEGRRSPGWRTVEGLDDLAAGSMTAIGVGGAQLVVARVGQRLLAYRDRCAECGAGVSDGHLDDGVLTCAACGTGFSLPMAGRAFNGGGGSLEPVPLLDDAAGGGVRVALEA